MDKTGLSVANPHNAMIRPKAVVDPFHRVQTKVFVEDLQEKYTMHCSRWTVLSSERLCKLVSAPDIWMQRKHNINVPSQILHRRI